MKNSKALTVFFYMVLAVLVGCIIIRYYDIKDSETTLNSKVQETVIKKSSVLSQRAGNTIIVAQIQNELAEAQKLQGELISKETTIDKRYQSFMNLIEMNKKALAVNLD